jgi:hypothetical protein
MKFPTEAPAPCPACGQEIIDGDDGNVGEHMEHVRGYNLASADIIAWFEALFPEAHSLIKRIKAGEPEGFAVEKR